MDWARYANPHSDHDAGLLPQIDRKIDEGGGWAAMKNLPGGQDYVWDLIERGVLEEEDGFVRRRHSNPVPPRATLETAVRAMQLYLGSMDFAPVRAEQKLLNRVRSKVQRVAESTGMQELIVWEQIEREARRRGVNRPMPGKDF